MAGYEMKNLSKIKVISFDADGTLWDFQKVMRHSLKHVLIELRDKDSKAYAKLSIEKMIEIRNETAEDLVGKENLEEIRHQAFRRTLEAVNKPNDELAKHLNEIYLKHRFEDIELFDDVLPTLTTLKEKYTLIIISNGNSYPEKCGLEKFIDLAIFSQDYNIWKPDKRLFEIAMEKAGCTTDEIVHIGDCLISDVLGAQRTGIDNFWLNRGSKPGLEVVNPENTIYSLTELIDILT
ncbi:MAG: HAD family hydrolase [Candidatus Heimdallarchaeota archaeon]